MGDFIERRLPSGLYVAEDPPPPPAPAPLPPEKQFRCRACDRLSSYPALPLLGPMADGWTIHRPVCPHGPYLVCPECNAEPDPGYAKVLSEEQRQYWAKRGCPKCGTHEEYT